MKKSETLDYYRVEEGAYIYAVNSEKYLKTISRS